MGKITEVFYAEIDPELCSATEAAKYHYHFNLLKYHKMFQDEYEKYENDHIKLRNTLIGNAIKSGEIQSNPKVYTTIFGISAQKDRAVLITEI